MEQRAATAAELFQQPCPTPLPRFLTVRVADHTVLCAMAGVAANSESAPSSSARAGTREKRARARRASELVGEASRERRGQSEPAGPLGRWAAGPLGRWAAGPLGRWAAGPLGRWAAGPLGRWAAGPLGRWAAGLHYNRRRIAVEVKSAMRMLTGKSRLGSPSRFPAASSGGRHDAERTRHVSLRFRHGTLPTSSHQRSPGAIVK